MRSVDDMVNHGDDMQNQTNKSKYDLFYYKTIVSYLCKYKEFLAVRSIFLMHALSLNIVLLLMLTHYWYKSK